MFSLLSWLLYNIKNMQMTFSDLSEKDTDQVTKQMDQSEMVWKKVCSHLEKCILVFTINQLVKV